MLDEIKRMRHELYQLNNSTKILIGKLLSSNISSKKIKNLSEVEFKVFSQFGDDGIIQYLINNLQLNNFKFVEFGVENYNESNTRFLLENNNWKGMVIDGSEENIEYIKKSSNFWRHDLTAICEFVTADNIKSIISNANFSENLDLLHIDLDGNDYWVWQALNCTYPVIAIIEYNSLFGAERAITVPYRPDFERFKAHYSGLYAGSSLAALCDLAQHKGYCFIGSNSAGNNAYFIRKDKVGPFMPLTCQQGYVQSKFREHRNKNGQLTYTSGFLAIEEIRGLPVFNTQTQQIEAF